MEPKTKKIIYISVGAVAVIALVYFGYKWYKKSQEDKKDAAVITKPAITPNVVLTGVTPTPAQNVPASK